MDPRFSLKIKIKNIPGILADVLKQFHVGHVFWLSENSLWPVQIYSQEGDDSLALFVRFRGITQRLIIGEPANCSKT